MPPAKAQNVCHPDISFFGSTTETARSVRCQLITSMCLAGGLAGWWAGGILFPLVFRPKLP